MSYANVMLFSSVLPGDDDEDNKSSNSTIQGKNNKTQGLGFSEFMGLMKSY